MKYKYIPKKTKVSYTRENLPPMVALIVAAYGIPREQLNDKFIVECNQTPIDNRGIYEAFCTCSFYDREKYNELSKDTVQLEFMMMDFG